MDGMLTLKRAGASDAESPLQRLSRELALETYPASFEAARALTRSVTLFVGPPNSGKSHTAFDLLAKVTSGVYLAPLRLLALSGRDELEARGVTCSLLTGEDSEPADGAGHTCSTIEMVDTTAAGACDLAVIDEGQMLVRVESRAGEPETLPGPRGLIPASPLLPRKPAV